MNWNVSSYQEMRFLNLFTLVTSSWLDRPISNPSGSIILFSIMFYIMGLSWAKREREVAKHKLPLSLNRILFLRLDSRYTLNTIFHQIYLIVVAITSLSIILFKSDIDSNRVANVYAVMVGPLFLIQVIFVLVRVEILGKKRKK